MKPLIIISIDGWVDRDRVEEVEGWIRKEVNKDGVLEQYEVLVLHGDGIKANVYYPAKPISYYFNKLKAWVFLKIWKRKKFSNTSVIL